MEAEVEAEVEAASRSKGVSSGSTTNAEPPWKTCQVRNLYVGRLHNGTEKKPEFVGGANLVFPSSSVYHLSVIYVCQSVCLSVEAKTARRVDALRCASPTQWVVWGGGGALQALGEHGGLFSLLVSARATCRFGPATHC